MIPQYERYQNAVQEDLQNSHLEQECLALIFESRPGSAVGDTEPVGGVIKVTLEVHSGSHST